MKRREFITLLGGVAAWPLTARAQQAGRVMRIGVLMSYVESDTTAHQWVKAFSQSLQESGWIDNQNIRVPLGRSKPRPSASQRCRVGSFEAEFAYGRSDASFGRSPT